MSAIPAIVPVSELRRNASEILNIVSDTNEPIVITQRGYAKAVLQDVESYQLNARRLEIAEALVRGEVDIAAGNIIDGDEVISRMHEKADALKGLSE